MANYIGNIERGNKKNRLEVLISLIENKMKNIADRNRQIYFIRPVNFHWLQVFAIGNT